MLKKWRDNARERIESDAKDQAMWANMLEEAAFVLRREAPHMHSVIFYLEREVEKLRAT